jgi:hypothetical protein
LTDEESITLIDEEGRELRFALHDAFELDGASYYLVEAAEDPEEVLLLRESPDGLESVEGDEFKRVISALEEDKVE